MWERLWGIVLEFWLVLGEMSPYLLFGFLMAGLLSVLVKPETVERHLGGHGIWPIIKSSAFGVPLPLCSCGVIPVAASLRKHGASRGATTSFLISTPQTGVDSIFVTLSLLGPVVAVFRPVAALVSGILGGSIVSLTQRNGELGRKPAGTCEDECCTTGNGGSKVLTVLRYGFITLPRDISKALLVGLFIAGIIAVFVPERAFESSLGRGISGMFVMMAFGIPLYVCATASVPIAAALIAKGASPGAAIVFLMTGPATNAAAIATIWRIMGRRTAIIYLFTVAGCALGAGFFLDLIIDNLGVNPHAGMHRMLPDFVKTGSAIVLLGVLATALYRPAGRKPHEKLRGDEQRERKMRTAVLEIEGMTCSHCANAVTRAITECAGVVSADVDLSAGTATIQGTEYDLSAIAGSIEELGYKVAGKEEAR